ncbi:hypothetical protein B0H14DRAFT_3533013 [Mycena olivaceomarginata]|nr:hypothetical protein B0H14DRAFT_3533013 [Mycena olivaceomarginata]
MAAHPHADTHSTRRTRRAQRRVRAILAATFAVALRLQIVDDQERLPQVIEQQAIAEFSNDDFGVAWTARDPSWNWGWETDWNGWGYWHHVGRGGVLWRVGWVARRVG